MAQRRDGAKHSFSNMSPTGFTLEPNAGLGKGKSVRVAGPFAGTKPVPERSPLGMKNPPSFKSPLGLKAGKKKVL